MAASQELDYRLYAPPKRLDAGHRIIVGRSIDTLARQSDIPTLYETKCFHLLAQKTLYGNDLLLGPHILNYLFGSSEAVATMPRPDALWLRETNEQLLLVGMAEFRSGTGIGMEEKLRGFQKFTLRLRKEPKLLPWLLDHALGDLLSVPDQILVPEPDRIEVVFIAPFRHGVSYTPTPDFGVTFWQVPNDLGSIGLESSR